MTIPFWILLIPYGIIILIFLVISGFGIYHSWRFGFRTTMVQSVTAAYLSGAAIILLLSIIGILTLDWSRVWEIGSQIDL